jgi:phospholipid/cholesterol/gamma-HCH transport system substrate-binding protein
LKLTKEIKTAILVIASILLFIWGYSFLKGRDLFTNYVTLYVEYETVEGLTTSAPVTINGLVIGKVNKITIEENTGKLLVELQINTDFPISKSSIAAIYDPGIISGKQIAIEPNFKDKSVSADGQRLRGKIRSGLTEAVADKLVPIQEKLQKIMGNGDVLITGINNVLDEKGQEDIKKSISKLRSTMEELHKASLNMNAILDNNKVQIRGVVSNFNKISDDFSKISDSLNKADLGKMVQTLNETLVKVDGIMNGLKAGNGTMGKLLNDDALYNNLDKTSKELELLLQDVRLHPTRYVNVSLFGKKDKPYKAPLSDSISQNKN